MKNLTGRVNLYLAPDGAGGSADNGTPAPGNAEELLNSAITGAAGAEGGKPAAKPDEGNNAAGGKKTESENVKLAAWTEQLPPEMKGNPDTAAKLAKFNKVGDMAKAFLELEGKASSWGIPGKDAAAEEVAAFWEKAGRPKTADGYPFAKDKEHNGDVFADAALKANLTAAQAEAMYKTLSAFGAQKLEEQRQTAATRMKETATALSAEYGSKYAEKMELLKRGLAAAGPNVGSLLNQAGLIGNPEIVKAFVSFGEMTAESAASRGGSAGDSMKSVSDGGAFDFKDI